MGGFLTFAGQQMTADDSEESASNLIAFDVWRRALGISPSTAYRYRERGIVTLVNVFGKLYIARDEIARFEARARLGEFAQQRGRPLKAKHHSASVAV